ncbi:MAG: biliverdin-producing heme oxygenase [Armatimonadetes bacterium]|nr:biliverdin-producing heme oxygenase [Armatimonadota bacterium]
MLLHLLRDATRREHEQLEARIDLLGRGWSLPFYRLLLQKFYGFYSVVEPPIFEREEWQQLGFDVESRRKTELLRRDLRHLGLSVNQIEALPRLENALPLSSFPRVLGCAYVLEGATLGGQVITRHLRREIGVEPEQGGAFFASYGALVGPMWRDFVALLDTFPVSADEQSALLESARATFRALDEWLGDIL